jgi:hypothetical protein
MTWNSTTVEFEGFKGEISSNNIGWSAKVTTPEGNVIPSISGHANEWAAKMFCENKIKQVIEQRAAMARGESMFA